MKCYPNVTQQSGRHGDSLIGNQVVMAEQHTENVRKKLTDAFIRAIRPEGRRVEYLDEGYTGRSSLYLRVGASGRKTWTFVYRFGGKIRRAQLGVYPELSLVNARRLAGEMVLSMDSGKDPRDSMGVEARETKASERINDEATFGHLAERYIRQYAMAHKRSWREDQRILKHDVLPLWGERDSASITKKDVVQLLDGLCERGVTVGANRALALVRKLFNWAVERGELEQNPARELRAPAKETAKERVLTDSELILFWQGLDKTGMSKSVKLALRFILVTGQRLGEVVQLQFDQIDGNIWTVPAEVAKNGYQHRVPLSILALDILEEALEGYDGDIVFRSPKSDSFLSATALSHAMRHGMQTLGIAPATPHDLRRTAASHMTMLGYNRVTVSKILNHVEGGVTAIYDRYSYDNEKEHALEAWAQKLCTLARIPDRRDFFSYAIENYQRPKEVRRYKVGPVLDQIKDVTFHRK